MLRIRVWLSEWHKNQNMPPSIDRKYASVRFVNHLRHEFQLMGYHVVVNNC